MKKKNEEQVKLPPIQNKKKGKDGGGKKKEDYPEHVVIMDAEDINKAIEGKKNVLKLSKRSRPSLNLSVFNLDNQKKLYNDCMRVYEHPDWSKTYRILHQ